LTSRSGEALGQVPLHRRADVQALAVLVVLAAAGAIARALGAPAWLTAAYTIIGVALAAARLRLRDRPAPPARARAAPDRPAARTAIGYVRAPAGRSEADVRTDAVAIAAWCEAHGFELTRVLRDTSPIEAPAPRALDAAVDHIAAGAAYALVAASLADIADTTAGLRSLLARLRAVGGGLVAIDVGLDTSTDAGRIAAAALASVAC
jgi:hypothetical protein